MPSGSGSAPAASRPARSPRRKAVQEPGGHSPSRRSSSKSLMQDDAPYIRTGFCCARSFHATLRRKRARFYKQSSLAALSPTWTLAARLSLVAGAFEAARLRPGMRARGWLSWTAKVGLGLPAGAGFSLGARREGPGRTGRPWAGAESGLGSKGARALVAPEGTFGWASRGMSSRFVPVRLKRARFGELAGLAAWPRPTSARLAAACCEGARQTAFTSEGLGGAWPCGRSRLLETGAARSVTAAWPWPVRIGARRAGARRTWTCLKRTRLERTRLEGSCCARPLGLDLLDVEIGRPHRP